MNQSHNPTEQFLNIFQGFRMPELEIDQYASVGRSKLAEKIEPFIAANKPIEFVMLGYPMKSMNDRDKVLGKLPDLGEELSLQNFGYFNRKVKEIYPPGISMNIVNDGYAFNDLMDIPDHTVAAYEEMCIDIASGMPIRFYDMHDFYNSGLRMSTMRDKLDKDFGITEAQLEERIMLDPEVNILYKGMIKFMTGDIAIRNFDSGNQLHKAAKKLARQMMLRNEAYSALVRSEFGSFVRLSMHPSVNNGTKYSFALIPGDKIRTSPWHSALLKTSDNDYATIRRIDGIEAGFELIYKDGRPHYFVQN